MLSRATPLVLLAAGFALAACSTPSEATPSQGGASSAPVQLLLADDGPWNRRVEERGGTIGGVWQVATDSYTWEAPLETRPVPGSPRDRLARMAAARRPTSPTSDPVASSEASSATPAAATPPEPKRRFLAPEPLRHTRAKAKATPILPKQEPRRTRRDGPPPKKEVIPPHLRFIANPTSIVAATVTIALPPQLAAEARLVATDVKEFKGGNRRGSGEARLTLRRLTLAADRIMVRVRTDEEEVVQIMARGQVDIDARLDAHQTEHKALRSLIITNERIIPLK